MRGQIGEKSKPRSGSSWGVLEEALFTISCDSKELQAQRETQPEIDQAASGIATVFFIAQDTLSLEIVLNRYVASVVSPRAWQRQG